MLRRRDDSTVPADNPCVGKPGSRPEICTIGQRDHHGITVCPPTGQIVEAELGPPGGDTIHFLEPRGNDGWSTHGHGGGVDHQERA